jgi:hypothetical protein
MKLTSLLEGLALGAGLMYLMDPQSGRRRQAMAKDQLQKQMKSKQAAIGVMQRDFMNRSRGMVTQFKAARTKGDIAADEIVCARIRSAMGRCCSHPKSVHCEVHNGEVTLTGQILTTEVQPVVQCVKSTRGVTKVVNNLDAVEDSTGISGLQGNGRIYQATRWSPATGMVMTGLGGLLTLYGLGRRGFMGTVFGTVGLGIAAKAIMDTEHRFDSSSSHPTEHPTSTSQRSITGNGSSESALEGYEGIGVNENTTYSEPSMSSPVYTEDSTGLI